MEYRRFGKTNIDLSVVTLGGMRYIHGWDDPREFVPNDTLEQCVDTIKKSFELGINHIETAYGYGKSEHVYGKALNEVLKWKRDSYYLMTKGAPKTASETREMIGNQLKALQTDYVDFYAWHGINTFEKLQIACAPGGPVEELYKMKNEGIIKHIGFSTHANYEVIIKAIETDMFEFVNLHYYYFFQRHKGAIDLAQSKDMGVFIISPNDKGGKLQTPPEKLSKLTHPISPVQWNARFCLSNPAIHTLSFGLPRTVNMEEIPGIFPVSVPLSGRDAEIKTNLDAQLNSDPYAHFDAYSMTNDPSGINIPEVLRFRSMAMCYDMLEFARYRYNMFQENDNWFQGAFPTEEKLKMVDLSKCPPHIPILDLLRETHQLLYLPPK